MTVDSRASSATPESVSCSSSELRGLVHGGDVVAQDRARDAAPRPRRAARRPCRSGRALSGRPSRAPAARRRGRPSPACLADRHGAELLGDMPKLVTIERASEVASCRSSWTPVERSPNSSRSPAVPARIAISWPDQVAAAVHDRLVAVGEHVRGGAERGGRGRRSRASARWSRRCPSPARRDGVGGLVDRDRPALVPRSAGATSWRGPATTRSIASSEHASASISLRPSRTVSRAASLTRLASSAPEKPGVRLAISVEVDVRFSNRAPARRAGVRISPRPWTSGASISDLAVEAARAQQRGVEDVGAVGGAHHDDAGVAAEAVHVDQQLVERLLALVVALPDAGARACGRRRRARR